MKEQKLEQYNNKIIQNIDKMDKVINHLGYKNGHYCDLVKKAKSVFKLKNKKTDNQSINKEENKTKNYNNNKNKSLHNIHPSLY